jgi:hypothetical protein
MHYAVGGGCRQDATRQSTSLESWSSGTIEVPPTRGGAELFQHVTNETQRGAGFINSAVIAMHARHVAIATVASAKNHPAGECGLDCCQQVEPVDPQRFSGNVRRQPFACRPRLECLIATRGTDYRRALPFGQLESVAYQFQRREGEGHTRWSAARKRARRPLSARVVRHCRTASCRRDAVRGVFVDQACRLQSGPMNPSAIPINAN